MSNRILLVRVPDLEAADGRDLRDYILESLAQGVLVLTEGASCEVMELPPLCGVDIRTTGNQEGFEANSDPPSLIQGDAEVKRCTLHRLNEYRKRNGLGCLEKVAEKTAHFRADRLSAETLRMIITGDAPKMDISEWKKISKALDALENIP